MAEVFVEDDVEDEVDGGVEDDERVGDGPKVEPVTATEDHLEGRAHPDDPDDELQHLADDQHDDDDDENERRRVPFCLVCCAATLPPTSGLIRCRRVFR